MANGTWRIARNRGSAQLPLVVFAVIAVIVVLVGKAQSTLFDRVRTTFSDWTAPVLESVNQPVDGVSRWFSHIGDIFTVYRDNQRLREENAKLKQWRAAALVMDERVKRYQLLLNAVSDPTLDRITARVIGRSSKPFLETMILNAGKTQGVQAGQAVVDEHAMIGRVFLTGERSAWVILLTDLNSRIPVIIMPGNIQAIMAGDNSVAPTLETLAQGAALKDGMQVLTSGDGGLLPPGLAVGTLVSDGTRMRVALLADAGTSDEVQVIDYKSSPEAPPAPSPNDLPQMTPLPPSSGETRAPATQTAGAATQAAGAAPKPADAAPETAARRPACRRARCADAGARARDRR